MSHLLVEWLSNEVSLSRPVNTNTIDSDFRSGYLIAEILLRHRLIDRLDKFQDADSPEIAIQNYIALEPTLKALGVPLSSTFAYEMVTGVPGAASKMLYHLKAGLLNLTKEQMKLPAPKIQLAGEDYRKVLNSTTRFVNEFSSKKAFLEKEHEFFAERLRGRFRRRDVSELGQTGKYSSRFKHEQQQLDELEEEFIKNNARKLKTMETPEAHSSNDGNANQTRSTEIKKDAAAALAAHQAQFLLKKLETRKEEHQARQKRIVQEYIKEIKQFDQRLGEMKSIAIEPVWMHGAEHKKFDISPRVPVAAAADPTGKPGAVGGFRDASDENPAYLVRIRSRKMEELEIRKERERRLVKTLQSQKRTQEEFEKSHQESLLIEKLARQSKQERRIAEQLLETKKEKEIMYQNRLFRNQQYLERRQKDYEEALHRESEVGVLMREEYKKQVEAMRSQYQDIETWRKQELHAKRYAFCEHVSRQIIELSLKIAETRETHNGVIPKRYLHEWMLLFFEGRSLEKKYTIPLTQDRIVEDVSILIKPSEDGSQNPGASDVDAETIKILDESELNDYLASTGDWHHQTDANSATASKNEILGDIVSSLLALSIHKSDPRINKPLLHSPLNVILLGKPFSGKDTLANSLAAEYDLQKVRVTDLINQAIDTFDSKECPESPLSNIGRKVKDRLAKGEEVEDNTVVDLVIHALSQPPQGNGFILVGYPKTRAQAALLEKEISGYEEYKPVKPGNIKREISANQNAKSLLAPTSAPDVIPTPTTFFDSVIFLEVTKENAMDRCAGKRQDALTGKVYHIRHNPPPSNDPGLLERLVSFDAEANQMQAQLSKFQSREKELKDWFATFGVLREIDANPSIEENFKNASDIVGKLIEDRFAKEFEAETVARAEAEASVLKAEQDRSGLQSATDSTKDEAVLATAVPTETPATTTQPTSRPQTTHAPVTTSKKEQPAPVTPVPNSTLRFVDRIFFYGGRYGPTKELAALLYKKWISLETLFTDTVKFSLRSLRTERADIAKYFYDARISFKEFINRPDDKQPSVEIFIRDFNSLDDDFIYDPDCKAELHLRTDELRDKFWEISDQRREDAEAERTSLIEQKWTENHLVILANIYIGLIQSELDRYVAVKQVLLDFGKDSAETMIDENQLQSPILNRIEGEVESIYEDLKVKKESSNKKRNFTTNQSSKKADKDRSNDPYSNSKTPMVLAVDSALSAALAFIAEDAQDSKDSKDKKKNNGEAIEFGLGILQKTQAALRTESLITQQRLERLAFFARQHMDDVRIKGRELFLALDEWIGTKFQREIDAARDLANFIREKIETEQRINELIILESDHLIIQSREAPARK